LTPQTLKPGYGPALHNKRSNMQNVKERWIRQVSLLWVHARRHQQTFTRQSITT